MYTRIVSDKQAVAIEHGVTRLVGQQFAQDPEEMNSCSLLFVVPPQTRVIAAPAEFG